MTPEIDWQPVSQEIQKHIRGLAYLETSALPRGVRQVLNALRTAGGRPLLVGGIVRDAVLALKQKILMLKSMV
jgi:hypothetical protein